MAQRGRSEDTFAPRQHYTSRLLFLINPEEMLDQVTLAAVMKYFPLGVAEHRAAFGEHVVEILHQVSINGRGAAQWSQFVIVIIFYSDTSFLWGK